VSTDVVTLVVALLPEESWERRRSKAGTGEESRTDKRPLRIDTW
jgi:hypothetical protein